MTEPLILGIDRTCAIEGCERTARQGRRRCSGCEHAISRYGDPHAKGSRKGKGQRLIDELLLLETDECIIWPHHTTKGYGYVRRDGRDVGVHVIACERHHGPAPSASHEVAHSCIETRACLNYRHLRWATRAENIADMAWQGTARRGERQHNHRLTADQVREARQMVAGGMAQQAVAGRFGVHQVTINDLVNRRTWAWLDPEEETA